MKEDDRLLQQTQWGYQLRRLNHTYNNSIAANNKHMTHL